MPKAGETRADVGAMLARYGLSLPVFVDSPGEQRAQVWQSFVERLLTAVRHGDRGAESIVRGLLLNAPASTGRVMSQDAGRLLASDPDGRRIVGELAMCLDRLQREGAR